MSRQTTWANGHSSVYIFLTNLLFPGPRYRRCLGHLIIIIIILLLLDRKRPDGLSLVPWQNGKALCCDVTVICPLADSYIAAVVRDAGVAAELAASRKEVKYAGLSGRYMFAPIAFENLRFNSPVPFIPWPKID